MYKAVILMCLFGTTIAKKEIIVGKLRKNVCSKKKNPNTRKNFLDDIFGNLFAIQCSVPRKKKKSINRKKQTVFVVVCCEFYTFYL